LRNYDAVDDRAQLRHAALERAIGGRGHPPRRRQRIPDTLQDIALHGRQRVAHRDAVAAHVEAEERHGSHLGGQVQHLVRDVDRLAVASECREAWYASLDALIEDRDAAIDGVACEEALNALALFCPLRAVARQ
jgi:hypothetical protein